MPQLIPGFQTLNGDNASASYLNGWWASAGMTVSSSLSFIGNPSGSTGTAGVSNWSEIAIGSQLSVTGTTGTWSMGVTSTPTFASATVTGTLTAGKLVATQVTSPMFLTLGASAQTNFSSLQLVTGLSTSVSSAQTYSFQGVILGLAPTSTSMSVSLAGSAVQEATTFLPMITAIGGNVGSSTQIAYTFNLGGSLATISAGDNGVFIIQGSIRFSASGTFGIGFCNLGTTSSPSTVQPGSWFNIWTH